MDVARTLLKPKSALVLGGVFYGMGVFYMATRYYQQCSMKKIYVNADKVWNGVVPLHVPGADPLAETTK